MLEPIPPSEATRLSKAEALAFMLLALLVLRLGGFARATKFLGLGRGSFASSPFDDQTRGPTRLVTASINRASAILNRDADCLPQCLAAAAMLRRRGIQPKLHLGVAKSQSDATHLYAHSWLSVGPFDVTGGSASGGFVEMKGQRGEGSSLQTETVETMDKS